LQFLGSNNLAEILAQATIEDLKTLADILGVTYQVLTITKSRLPNIIPIGIKIFRVAFHQNCLTAENLAVGYNLDWTNSTT